VIAGTNKEASSVNNPVSGMTTASVAFQNNTLYLVSVIYRGATADTLAISGGGLTWTKRIGGLGRELWEGFTASGATTGVLTFTWSGTNTGTWWSIDEFTGVDTTTRIVQAPAQATGTGTSGSVTLAAFGDAVNNAAFGYFEHTVDELSTAEAGYTTLANISAALAPSGSLLTAYKVGEDISVTASWTTSAAWKGHAVEIKAAAGGNATATPATVAVVVAVPSPSVQATAIATPSTLAVAVSVPSPTVIIGTDAIAQPASVNVLAAMPSPTVKGAARPTPATLAVVVTIGSVTVVVVGPVVAGTADMRLLRWFTAELQAATQHTTRLEILDRYTAELDPTLTHTAQLGILDRYTAEMEVTEV